MKTNLIRIDHEQSLFFFRFSEGSARARSFLFHLAPSATRVVIFVSRAFYSTDQEKRLCIIRIWLIMGRAPCALSPSPPPSTFLV